MSLPTGPANPEFCLWVRLYKKKVTHWFSGRSNKQHKREIDEKELIKDLVQNSKDFTEYDNGLEPEGTSTETL